MLSLDTAYRSFGGEVEALSTPTICRLPDSRRHQLSAIARRRVGYRAHVKFSNDAILMNQPPLADEGLQLTDQQCRSGYPLPKLAVVEKDPLNILPKPTSY